MRWAVVLLLVAGTASARVVMIPTIARECREARSWDAVMKCVGNHGKATLAKALPHARLVRLEKGNEDFAISELYLFVETKGWQLGGMYTAPGTILGFDSPMFAGRPVYHVEIGTTSRSGTELVLRHEELFCTGTGYRCSGLVSACDVLVDGKTIETFRGTVTWEHNHLHIAGDRTHAGNECQQPETVELMFPQVELD